MYDAKIEALYRYFNYLTETYHIQMSFHDYSGVIMSNSALASRLHPFLIHGNSFCMHVKSHKELFDECLSRRKWIAEKCRKEKRTFFGMCYMGVEEYVVPVFHHEQLIACIFAGCFPCNKGIAKRLIERSAKKYHLSPERLQSEYDESFNQPLISIEFIEDLTQIVAQYLEYFYVAEIAKKEAHELQPKTHSKEDYILPHILEYIHKNYTGEVSVPELAKYCHCSDSTIHHLFKKRMQVNISTFVNRLRIQEAKKLLSNTNLSMKEIAMRSGFNDPNYFSKVFCDICGVFPTKYRREHYILNPLGK